MRVLAFLAAIASVICLAGFCSAQTYSDWSVSGSSWDKGYSVGLQLGLPLVAGVDISGHFTPRLVASLGFGFIPGLITLGGQVRLNILKPVLTKSYLLSVPVLTSTGWRSTIKTPMLLPSTCLQEGSVCLVRTIPSACSWDILPLFLRAQTLTWRFGE